MSREDLSGKKYSNHFDWEDSPARSCRGSFGPALMMGLDNQP
jgi:hypothetical protein